MTHSYLGLSFVAFTCLALVGCGPAAPPSGEVSGKVTYLNKPVTTGTITFVPKAEEMPYAQATIQPDGTYQAETKEFGKRVPIGDYRVMISAVDTSNPDEPAMPLIPFRYSSEAQSGLEANVQEGENTVDFTLKK